MIEPRTSPEEVATARAETVLKSSSLRQPTEKLTVVSVPSLRRLVEV